MLVEMNVIVWSFLATTPEMIYGQVSDDTKFQHLILISFVLLFVDLIPHDGVAMGDIATVILPVALTLILFEIAGLVFAIVCLVFNIVHRNKKQVLS